jgi:hypothetical protein
MTLATILDKAEALRREAAFDRKHNLPPVPFVAVEQRGWLDLEDEIATEFDRLSGRGEDIVLVYEIQRTQLKTVLRDRHREWTALMLSCGRCIHCGKPRGADGTKRNCRYHADLIGAKANAWAKQNRERVNAYVTKQREKAKANGLCVQRCGRPVATSGGRCVDCRARDTESTRRWRERNPGGNARRVAEYRRMRFEAGLCRDCPEPRVKSSPRCQAHLDRAAAQRRCAKAMPPPLAAAVARSGRAAMAPLARMQPAADIDEERDAQGRAG